MVRTLPPASPGSTIPTNKTLLDLVASIHEYIVETFGDPTEYSTSYIMAWADEYGWSDCESPLLMWEEGDYEWAQKVETHFVENDLVPPGYFLECANSWALGIYPQ